MEKKKLLLVAITVGVFLVIAIGAAIAFTPEEITVPTRVIAASPAPVQTDNTKNDNQPSMVGVPSGTHEPVDNPLPRVQGSGESSGSIVAAQNIPARTSQPTSSPAATETRQVINQNAPLTQNVQSNQTSGGNVISVPRPNAAAVPAAPSSPAQPVRTAPLARQNPAPVAVKPAPKAETSTTQTSRGGNQTASASRPAAPARTRETIPKDFWVQAGSFSTVVSAEGVKQSLESRGIKSVIENRNVDGKDMFRVRIGPYTSQNEADFWLSLVKSIDGFENSMVWESQVRN